MAAWIYWVGGVIVVLILYVILTYNRFVVLRNRIERAFSQIDVQLKRRADLIPKLVDAVKGYMKHERTTLESLTRLRTSLGATSNLGKMAALDAQLSKTIASVFAVAEQYPNLKANENFLLLQEEIAGTENKIAYARQFYNSQVLRLDNLLRQFPTNLVGSLFHVKPQAYFKATEQDRKDVAVNL